MYGEVVDGIAGHRFEQVLADIHDWIAADEERIAQALGIDTPNWLRSN